MGALLLGKLGLGDARGARSGYRGWLILRGLMGVSLPSSRSVDFWDNELVAYSDNGSLGVSPATCKPKPTAGGRSWSRSAT